MPAGPEGPAPEVETLHRLGSDAWAVILAALRRTLAEEPHRDDRSLAALRDAPTSRLAGGRGRRSLTRRLATDPALWTDVAARIERGASDEVDALLEPGTAAAETISDPAADTTSGPAGGRASTGEHTEALERSKGRLRDARRSRDDWRRRAEGAEVRAANLEDDLATSRAELDVAQRALEDATAALEAAERDRVRAVERAERRQRARVAELEEQLATLRRREEERRTQARRREEARSQADRQERRASEGAQRRAREERPPKVVPGRPSRLPAGVAPGTTEAARELLHRGRLVLVDGYNVTKQHRGHLDLETQRAWLVQQVGILVRQRGIRPIVVFDGQDTEAGRPISAREVPVRFSAAPITADDELVFAVEGTDEPVVVVTDDRELTTRVQASGADVIGTRSFLGVVS